MKIYQDPFRLDEHCVPKIIFFYIFKIKKSFLFIKMAKMLPKFWFRLTRNCEIFAQISISWNSREISQNTIFFSFLDLSFLKTWNYNFFLRSGFVSVWRISRSWIRLIIYTDPHNWYNLYCITMWSAAPQTQGWAPRSPFGTFRSFPLFFRVFGDLWDPKERSVLF